MRLWIVHHHATPPTRPGITRHHQLAQALVARGYEVTIIACSVDRFSRRDEYLKPSERFHRSTIDQVDYLWIRGPLHAEGNIRRLLNMLNFAWKVVTRVGMDTLASPDLILGSSPSLFAAFAAHLLSRRLKVPFILEVRDIWPQTVIDLGNVSRFHPLILLMSAMENQLYRRAVEVFYVPPNAHSYLLRKKIPTENLFYFPNFVNLTERSSPSEAVERKPFCMMYIGAHGIANGLENVLESAKKLLHRGIAQDQICFRLIGDGPRKPSLIDYARKEKLSNVAFEPAVPKGNIFSVLQEADAFLMPLRKAGVFSFGVSPNKLADYFSAARPVVYAVNSANDPVTAAGAGLAIPPDQPDAMADAIIQLAKMPLAQRLEMGRRGREYVSKHHDLEHLINQVDIRLKKLVNTSPAIANY